MTTFECILLALLAVAGIANVAALTACIAALAKMRKASTTNAPAAKPAKPAKPCKVSAWIKRKRAERAARKAAAKLAADRAEIKQALHWSREFERPTKNGVYLTAWQIPGSYAEVLEWQDGKWMERGTDGTLTAYRGHVHYWAKAHGWECYWMQKSPAQSPAEQGN